MRTGPVRRRGQQRGDGREREPVALRNGQEAEGAPRGRGELGVEPLEQPVLGQRGVRLGRGQPGQRGVAGRPVEVRGAPGGEQDGAGPVARPGEQGGQRLPARGDVVGQAVQDHQDAAPRQQRAVGGGLAGWEPFAQVHEDLPVREVVRHRVRDVQRQRRLPGAGRSRDGPAGRRAVRPRQFRHQVGDLVRTAEEGLGGRGQSCGRGRGQGRGAVPRRGRGCGTALLRQRAGALLGQRAAGALRGTAPRPLRHRAPHPFQHRAGQDGEGPRRGVQPQLPRGVPHQDGEVRQPWPLRRRGR